MNNVKAQKLRNLAFRKLKENRSRFNSDEIFNITEIIRECRIKKNSSELDYSAITIQIARDIKIYKKYDCLAIWLDWNLGLVKYELDLIEKIAEKVGGLKIEGE